MGSGWQRFGAPRSQCQSDCAAAAYRRSRLWGIREHRRARVRQRWKQRVPATGHLHLGSQRQWHARSERDRRRRGRCQRNLPQQRQCVSTLMLDDHSAMHRTLHPFRASLVCWRLREVVVVVGPSAPLHAREQTSHSTHRAPPAAQISPVEAASAPRPHIRMNKPSQELAGGLEGSGGAAYLLLSWGRSVRRYRYIDIFGPTKGVLGHESRA